MPTAALYNQGIRFENAFYLGTQMGGTAFDRVGSFEKGYRFDAIVIDGIEDEGFPMDAAKRIDRFCFLGDDRNIVSRYIDGKPICV
jgi:guanine deaminase